MNEQTLIDIARTLHLVGLATGFGLALFTDMRVLFNLPAPIDLENIDLLESLHTAITIGLVILWSSGLCLLYLRTGFDLNNFTPKLMMKLSVVSILTVNSILIAKLLLPAFKRNIGLSFLQLPAKARAIFGLVAGVSFACWSSAFALGVFGQMKLMSNPELLTYLGMIFVPVLIGSTAISMFAPAVFNRIQRIEILPTSDMTTR